MYSYIYGKVTQIEPTYITLDNSGIGYRIATANPYAFQMDDEYKIYIYHHIREDEQSLYGFKTEEEKNLFLKLIEVKGVGPKTALPMLATGSVNGIIDAVERENILYLKKFPKIGDKVARQIILDLKGKLVASGEQVNINNDELFEALKGLGYKQSDINKIVPKVDHDKPIEEQIKDALKLFLK